MTTHELAHKLLEGLDEKVILPLGLDHDGEDTGAHDTVRRIYRTNVQCNEYGYLEHDIYGSAATVLETH